MQVLFLDIDGVLNRFGDEDGKGSTTERFDGLLWLDAQLLQIYKALLSRIDVTVVLSSSWRLSRELREYLAQHGVYFHDVTPCMDPALELLRGHEIQLWLNEYPDQVERYAILDDQEEEMLEDHMPNFFHVSCETGLTQELADRIVGHLTSWRSSR
jgi:hypothetical protein